MAKLILMDGNSIAFRAFYGLPLLTNQSGLHTNAIFGYARLLEKVIKEEDPDYFLVAFDAGKSTFRHKQYTEYKGGRQKTPPELGEQFAPIRKLIDAYGIKRFEHEDYEADDIIGTWTKLADKENFETIVITGDKDLTQLASDHTKVYITKKGVTDIEVYTPDHVSEVYDGLKPLQIIDLKGLMGDKSDNIPGVPGVGEKTAVKLLKEYGSVEEVLNNLENISGKKLNENLTNNQDIALMSKDLATIYRDMTFDFNLDDLKFKNEDSEEKYELFKELEFNSLLNNMEAAEVEEVATFTAEPTDSLNDFGDDISIYLEVHADNYLKHKPEYIGIADRILFSLKQHLNLIPTNSASF
jgi:5''-3'' exonuclease (including N-terminal domain of PolI)